MSRERGSPSIPTTNGPASTASSPGPPAKKTIGSGSARLAAGMTATLRPIACRRARCDLRSRRTGRTARYGGHPRARRRSATADAKRSRTGHMRPSPTARQSAICASAPRLHSQFQEVDPLNRFIFAAIALLAMSDQASVPAIPTSALTDMRWRMIGPHRASRTKAVAGIPWIHRTPSTSASTTAASGRRPTTAAPGCRSSTTSRPARSARSPSRRPQPRRHLRRQRRGPAAARPVRPATASTSRPTPARRGRISACATASRSRRSSSTRAIPNRLFVAVLGHPYGPNAERGIFRSTDGGKTFEKVLYKDENTGGVDVAFDPTNPHTSTPRSGRRGRARGRTATFAGPGSGLFKSTDGGTTWRQLTSGLPTSDGERLGPHRHRRRAERSVAPLRDRRSAHAPAASIAPTTPARAGRA